MIIHPYVIKSGGGAYKGEFEFISDLQNIFARNDDYADVFETNSRWVYENNQWVNTDKEILINPLVVKQLANPLTGALFVVHSLMKKHPYSPINFGVNTSSYAGFPVKYLKDSYFGEPIYEKSLMREYMKQMTNTEYLPVFGEEIYFYENNGEDIHKLYKVQLQELTPGNGELLCFFELGTPAEVFGLDNTSGGEKWTDITDRFTETLDSHRARYVLDTPGLINKKKIRITYTILGQDNEGGLYVFALRSLEFEILTNVPFLGTNIVPFLNYDSISGEFYNGLVSVYATMTEQCINAEWGYTNSRDLKQRIVKIEIQ